MPEDRFLHLNKISKDLNYRDDGIWYPDRISTISYPENGNILCSELEDSSFWFLHRNNCILGVLKTYPPATPFFDIGGGNGFVAASILNSGLDTVLIEPGMHGAKIAKSRGLNQIICSTLDDAKFFPHSLPSIGLFDTLEHIDRDEKFLIQLKSLIKPIGRLYLTVPAYPFLWSNDDQYAQHHRRYTLSSLTKKLLRCGFEIEYKTYIFRFLPLPIFFIRTLPSKMGIQKSANLNCFRKEHSLGGIWTKKILQHLMEIEIKNISAKKIMSFGGSCLVVARNTA